MRPRRHNISLGQEGERIAEDFLKKQGYRILAADFRSPLGQIDIVARDKEAIVFVEVKTRANCDFGLPEEALTYAKRKKIISLGWLYLKKYNLCGADCRFDIVSILKTEEGFSVKLIKGAFGEG